MILFLETKELGNTSVLYDDAILHEKSDQTHIMRMQTPKVEEIPREKFEGMHQGNAEQIDQKELFGTCNDKIGDFYLNVKINLNQV